jgi:hypothetical protein
LPTKPTDLGKFQKYPEVPGTGKKDIFLFSSFVIQGTLESLFPEVAIEASPTSCQM